MTEQHSAVRFDKAREELIARTPTSAQPSARAAKSLAMEVVQTVVMPHPIYIECADGGRLTDVDGNVYLDLTGGFGRPHPRGHRPGIRSRNGFLPDTARGRRALNAAPLVAVPRLLLRAQAEPRSSALSSVFVGPSNRRARKSDEGHAGSRAFGR